MDGVLIKGRNVGTETRVEEVSVKTWREESRLHAKERGLEQHRPHSLQTEPTLLKPQLRLWSPEL